MTGWKHGMIFNFQATWQSDSRSIAVLAVPPLLSCRVFAVRALFCLLVFFSLFALFRDSAVRL